METNGKYMLKISKFVYVCFFILQFFKQMLAIRCAIKELSPLELVPKAYLPCWAWKAGKYNHLESSKLSDQKSALRLFTYL